MIVHFRERDEEHPGIAICGIPPNEEGISKDRSKTTCPRCLRLLRLWDENGS